MRPPLPLSLDIIHSAATKTPQSGDRLEPREPTRLEAGSHTPLCHSLSTKTHTDMLTDSPTTGLLAAVASSSDEEGVDRLTYSPAAVQRDGAALDFFAEEPSSSPGKSSHDGSRRRDLAASQADGKDSWDGGDGNRGSASLREAARKEKESDTHSPPSSVPRKTTAKKKKSKKSKGAGAAQKRRTPSEGVGTAPLTSTMGFPAPGGAQSESASQGSHARKKAKKAARQKGGCARTTTATGITVSTASPADEIDDIFGSDW